jgi:hypothetical protein
MKAIVIIVIIGIVVAIGVISVIVAMQQEEISDIRRQEYLESSVAQCNLILVNVNMFNNNAVNQARSDWESCFDIAMEEYGNSFQKENWELQKQQTQNDWQVELEESASLDLDEYWALRYKEVSEPIKQQAEDKELQALKDEMNACLENASLIECMKTTTEPEPEEPKPYCLSPKYKLVEYTVSVRYHYLDKNQNGYYCVYTDYSDGETDMEDDRGLR